LATKAAGRRISNGSQSEEPQSARVLGALNSEMAISDS
jgi:hypothetical protein